MYVLSIISFLLLGGFLLLAAMRFGVPAMVSDVYYQLQNCTGSEVIGDKRKQNYGWVFTLIMFVSAILMLITAAIGCVGWCSSVNLAPTLLLAIAVLIIYFPPAKKPKVVGYYWAELAAFLDVYLTYWIFAL